MARTQRFHLDEPPGDNVARHLTAEQFGRRLYKLMGERGWNQSELARRADITRDRVSNYARGKSLPQEPILTKLATALGMTREELLPNVAETAIAYDRPVVDLRVSEADPTRAWLRINRLVTYEVATQILGLLAKDKPHETSDTG